MSKKKKDDDIILSCLGTSLEGVTGSCWSVSYKKDNGERGLVVVECGLDQGEPTVEKLYNSNKRMIDNIGKDIIRSASHVFLGHAHIDHIGNLAIFNDDNGFQGKILGSKETIEVGKQLIKDSVYIHSKNIEYLKSSKGKRVSSLYTEPQMYQMFEHMEWADVGEKIKVDDNLTVSFHTNSHVIGATSISLYIRKPSNKTCHILYSSDMGSKLNRDLQPFLREPSLPKKCNVFISEATYNDKNRHWTRNDAVKEREELKKYIKQCIHENKRILFATFSFSRCQLLMCLLYEWFKDEEWFKDIPIVIDGLLSNKINETYLNILDGEEKEYFKKVMSMRNLKFNKSYDGTIATLSKRTCGIYLAGSGFLENGRITTYLPQFLSSSKDVVILTGYAGGEGSLGYKVLDENQKTVTIEKRVIYKKATIKQLKTFSSHISRDELMELFSEINCDKIIVHHSDENGKGKFIEDAKEYLKSKCKTTPVVAVGSHCSQFVL